MAATWCGGEAGSPSSAESRRTILSEAAVGSHENGPSPLPGGAVRDEIAALLGTSSQARDPATDDNNSAEGAAKEEDALT